MEIKVKICGMKERANIEEIAALKPDYMGFIFYRNSPRFVGERFNLDWFQYDIKKVGVFVNQPLEEVVDLATYNCLDVVQLHGSEGIAYCEILSERKPELKIWKSFSVYPGFDLAEMEAYRDATDAYLLDTKDELLGGSGRSFDWEILKKLDGSKDIVLAGGIGPENIEKVLGLKGQGIKIAVVDVNSKTETSPGIKSILLAEEVINKVHA